MLPRESAFFKRNRRIPRFLPIAGHQRPLSIRWLVDERDGNLGEEEKKKAEDALVHEKSKLFSYIPLTRLCFLLSSFLAPSCLFFFPFERICWMFNESLKWGCFCWFDCGFCGQFFSFFFGEIGRTEKSRLRIGEVEMFVGGETVLFLMSVTIVLRYDFLDAFILFQKIITKILF